MGCRAKLRRAALSPHARVRRAGVPCRAGCARGGAGDARNRRPGFGKPVARTHRLGQGLLCRRGLAGRSRLRAVERRAGAATRRRLARHRHADRACRSVARRRHGRADRGGADRRPGAALRSRRQAEHHQHEGAQGQGDIARRAEGHHPHLCRAHAGAERRLSRATSTWCSPAPRRRALRRCSPARSMPRFSCRRSTFRRRRRDSTASA